MNRAMTPTVKTEMTTLMGGSAVPYCGPVLAPDQLFYAWNGDLWLFAGLASAALAMVWYRTTTHFSALRDRALIIAGIGLVVAFVSPLCAATVALFSARTLHHVVLLSVVAPAMAIAMPLRVLPAALAMGGTSIALVVWHLPAAYDAAWNNELIYWAMQAGLLLPAWIFWSAVLNPYTAAGQMFTHVLSIGGLAAVMGFIGAVLTFAPNGLYPQHLVGTEAFGLSLLADQQLAGLIMWVPGFLPLIAIAFWMMRRGWKQGFAA